MDIEVIELPTIYKRTSTGKIQEWRIQIHGNKYRTISGQTTGKKTESKFTICKGKNGGKANETSDEEQALKEATAKRRLKLEGEYTETQEECDGNVGFVLPMLAKNYKDYADETVWPVWSDKKYNGMRCVITGKGMFSRKGKPIISAPHIWEAVKHLFERRPDLVLDGELYNHEYRDRLNRILELVRLQKPTAQDLLNSEKMVEYHVYDGYNFGYDKVEVEYATINTKFSDRKLGLNDVILGIKYLFFVQSDLANNQKELDTFYTSYLADGYEGQMVRLDGVYENKRSRNLLKRKEFIDEEFEIISIDEGTGNKTGMVGALWLKLPEVKTGEDGETWDRFKSNLKGDHPYCKKLWEEREQLIGKMATCKFFAYSEYGVPQFPYVIAVRDYE